MDRDAAFALIRSLGIDPLYSNAGRTLADESVGYGPALDRAFAAYTIMQESDTALVVVADGDTWGFQFVLQATAYDVILPFYATMVDSSIDAPLSSAKFSQQYKALKQLRDAAWADAANYGYAVYSNMAGMKANLDFLEPCESDGAEYG